MAIKKTRCRLTAGASELAEHGSLFPALVAGVPVALVAVAGLTAVLGILVVVAGQEAVQIVRLGELTVFVAADVALVIYVGLG